MDPNSEKIDDYFDEYERRLNAILKTRRDEEKIFVEKVVEKLKQDKLPIKLVDSSFEWVRNRRPDTDYPFYYFERVLRLEAAKLNLLDEVPPFDYSKVQVTGIRAPGQQLNASHPTERQRESLFSRFFRFPGLFRSD
jgi:protease II